MDQNKVCSQQKGKDVPKKEKHSKRGDMPSGSSQRMREELQIGGGTKGDHGFRGRPNRHWMMVSIQASVSSSIC